MSDNTNTTGRFEPDYKQLGYTLDLLQRAAKEVSRYSYEAMMTTAECGRKIAEEASDLARKERMAAPVKTDKAKKYDWVFPPSKDGRKLVGIQVDYSTCLNPDTVELPATVYIPQTGNIHVLTGRKGLGGGYPCSSTSLEYGKGLVRRHAGSTLYTFGFVHPVSPTYEDAREVPVPADTIKRLKIVTDDFSAEIAGEPVAVSTPGLEYCIYAGRLHKIVGSDLHANGTFYAIDPVYKPERCEVGVGSKIPATAIVLPVMNVVAT